MTWAVVLFLAAVTGLWLAFSPRADRYAEHVLQRMRERNPWIPGEPPPADPSITAIADATRDDTTVPPARPVRPRLGFRGIGTPIEHITMRDCPDCVWQYDGQPVSWPCAIHTRPQPGDDLSLWDAELGNSSRQEGTR